MKRKIRKRRGLSSPGGNRVCGGEGRLLEKHFRQAKGGGKRSFSESGKRMIQLRRPPLSRGNLPSRKRGNFSDAPSAGKEERIAKEGLSNRRGGKRESSRLLEKKR